MSNGNAMPNMAMVSGPPGANPMNNNGAIAVPFNGAPRPQPQNPEQKQHLLNTYIYEYFMRNDMYDCARTLLSTDPGIKIQEGPNTRRDETGHIVVNGDLMDVDSKDGIDVKGADGLPQPNVPSHMMDSPFLPQWFNLFWDMFSAQKGKAANTQVSSYMQHTQAQHQNRMRQSAQQQALLRDMNPAQMNQAQQQQFNMMRMQQQNAGIMQMKNPNNMAQRAMANSQTNPQAGMQMLQQQQQQAAQQQQQQQQQKQGQMQRDPSDMSGDRARQNSPGSTDNAPSPKRIRLQEGAPFNPNQGGMMPNGRPAGQGMPGQQVGGPDPSSVSSQQLVQILQYHGINPDELNPSQFQTLQMQAPNVQSKTIASYANSLQQQQQSQMPKVGMPNANPTGPPGQGSPMVAQGPDGTGINQFYNAGEMGGPGAPMRPAVGGPNPQQPGGSNHALQDYQMQLMLLEQQNKKRLMMARQEQDNGNGGMQMPREGGPNGPPGAPPGAAAPFGPVASPQGSSRTGASPNPADMKRGPHQMNPPGGMGSPMAEGSQSRGSPSNGMFMGNQMDPNQAPQQFMNNNMAGGMAGAPQMNGLRPPSSHPGQPPFTGPGMNPQQAQIMAARQGMAGQPGQQMQWAQGGPGGPNGNSMPPQGQTPQQIQGTPQQRNAMPPPAQPAAAGAVNARNTSSPQVANAAPPTPSQQSKANPKKKDSKNAKDKKKSNSNLNAAGATPVAEPAAEESTPATPMTPVHPQQNLNRPGQNGGPNQGMQNGQAPAPVPQQNATPMVPQPDQNQNTAFMDGMPDFALDFANPLATADVLNDFDFDSFLHDNENGNDGFDFGNQAFMDADGIET